MERYKAYKDSGVDWIGEIPAGWNVRPLCRDFQIVAGATPKSGVEEYWNGNIPWITPADLGTKNIVKGSRFITRQGLDSCGTTLIPVGSIVVSNRAPIGQVAITAQTLCTNQGCKCLVPDGSIDSAYAYYYLSYVAGPLNAYGQGTTFLELSRAALASFPCPVPNTSEQQAIADYLDKKTEAIDAATKDIERSIKLLNEYRQSVISEAVTKGIDPNVPMKDSGIDWIGRIPENWHIVPLKYVIDSIESGTSIDASRRPAANGEYGVLTLSAVYQSQFNPKENKAVAQSDIAKLKCLVEQGSLLVSRCNTSEWVGTAAYVSEATQNLYLPDKIWQLRFRTDILTRWVWYALRSQPSRSFFAFASSGASQTMQNITKDNLLSVSICIPPTDEMEHAVAMLEAKITQLDSLIQQKQSLLVKLKEYRASLISECVTGRIKVPGVKE